MILFSLFILNIVFMMCLWHMSWNIDHKKMSERKTSGMFIITSEQAYRFSEYTLIAVLIVIDILFVTLQ